MDLANGDRHSQADSGGGDLIVLEVESDLGEDVLQGDKDIDSELISWKSPEIVFM